MHQTRDAQLVRQSRIIADYNYGKMAVSGSADIGLSASSPGNYRRESRRLLARTRFANTFSAFAAMTWSLLPAQAAAAATS